jgi:hypothetical protein
VDELERLVVGGAQHLILDPVVPGATRVETLVADVVRPLAGRFS